METQDKLNHLFQRRDNLDAQRQSIEKEIERIDKEIARQVTDYREENAISQETFAAFAGISQPYLSQIEKEQRPPSSQTVSFFRSAVTKIESTPPEKRALFASNARSDAARARRKKAG